MAGLFNGLIENGRGHRQSDWLEFILDTTGLAS